MANQEYITSERFIWDDLVERGTTCVQLLRQRWNPKIPIPRMIFAWPSVNIRDDQGQDITDIVSMKVPDGTPMFRAAVDLTARTSAYAILVVEQHPEEVKVILEAHHGTFSWTMRIARHGDVTVLEKEKTARDTDSIGILWRPRSTSN